MLARDPSSTTQARAFPGKKSSNQMATARTPVVSSSSKSDKREHMTLKELRKKVPKQLLKVSRW